MASVGGSWSPHSHCTWGLWESCSPEVPLCVALWWPSCPLCSVCRPVGEVKLGSVTEPACSGSARQWLPSQARLGSCFRPVSRL